jgi:hypothetical protein
LPGYAAEIAAIFAAAASCRFRRYCLRAADEDDIFAMLMIFATPHFRHIRLIFALADAAIDFLPTLRHWLDADYCH